MIRRPFCRPFRRPFCRPFRIPGIVVSLEIPGIVVSLEILSVGSLRIPGFRRLTRDSRNRRLTRDSRIPDFFS